VAKSTVISLKKSRAVPVSKMVESIVGCKWSLSVLAAIRTGVRRPGELERACAPISTKVLNERLRKMLRFGIVERESFGEIPPRVEYRLTGLGQRFVRLLDEIESLQTAVDDGAIEKTATRTVRRKAR